MPFGVQVVVPAALAKMADSPAELMSSLRASTPEIAELIESRIRQRSPRDTGGLRDAIDSQAYTGGVSGTNQVMLAKWYANDGPQLDAWNRVYVAYQEGPPLGLSTYTRGEHHMFEQVESTDLGLIEAWAEAAVNQAVNRMMGGGGSQVTTYGG